MGGGSKKKPISKAQPAEEREKEKKEEKGKKGKEEKGKKEEKALSQYDVNEELYNAIISTLRKNKVQTAYDLSAALGVKYGLTLRALKDLQGQGKVKLISKNRRSMLFALP